MWLVAVRWEREQLFAVRIVTVRCALRFVRFLRATRYSRRGQRRALHTPCSVSSLGMLASRCSFSTSKIFQWEEMTHPKKHWKCCHFFMVTRLSFLSNFILMSLARGPENRYRSSSELSRRILQWRKYCRILFVKRLTVFFFRIFSSAFWLCLIWYLHKSISMKSLVLLSFRGSHKDCPSSNVRNVPRCKI